jgi:hypothetical protein
MIKMNKTHDFSAREWGHNYNILDIKNEGLEINIAGWGRGLSNDDYIIIRNGDDTTRYKLDAIEYEHDPSDMWFASASFAPRENLE